MLRLFILVNELKQGRRYIYKEVRSWYLSGVKEIDKIHGFIMKHHKANAGYFWTVDTLTERLHFNTARYILHVTHLNLDPSLHKINKPKSIIT